MARTRKKFAPSSLPFEVASEVTPDHGKSFVDHLLQSIRPIANSAVFESGVLLEMPPEGEDAPSADEQRYMDLGHEIAAEFMRELKPAASAAFEVAAARVLDVPRAASSPEASDAARLDAIRKFFATPQDEYGMDELRLILCPDIAEEDLRESLFMRDSDQTTDRDALAGYVRAYVRPSLVARAVAGLAAGPLTPETRQIELPRWMWTALDKTARLHAPGWSGADVIFSELESSLTAGCSAIFEESAEIPEYHDVVEVAKAGRSHKC